MFILRKPLSWILPVSGIVMLWGIAYAEPNPPVAGTDTGLIGVQEKNFHAARALIHFYGKYISRVDGNRCPMHPSCSQYASQAIERHGFFKGWIMTCDRLLRCGRDEIKHSPQVWKNGCKHTLDPIEQNDLWK